MDHRQAAAIVDSGDASLLSRHLLTSVDAERLAVARELTARLKLKIDLAPLRFAAPVLAEGLDSPCPEVLEALSRLAGRLITESWATTAAHVTDAQVEERLWALVERNHGGIRPAAVLALVGLALRRGEPEGLRPLWRHPASKVRAAAANAASQCIAALMAVEPLIGALVEALRDADKRGTKAIDRALSAWLDTPRATLSYRYALQAASDQLRELDVPQAAGLHARVEARLTERLKVTPIERHFEALKRADGTERMELIDKISKYFAYKQITPDELTDALTSALAHPDPQTRKALADVVTDAQWSLDRPMTLLEHSDEAVRQGAQERFAYLKPLIEAARPLTDAQVEARNQEAKRAHERRLQRQRDNGVDPKIQELLRELFDDDMRERWGWGEHFEVGWRTEPGPLSEAKVGRVSCLALRVSFYMLSSVTVDLRARRVVCEAIDQKTPQDTVWTLHPSADWWRRAMQCPTWPVGERFEDMES